MEIGRFAAASAVLTAHLIAVVNARYAAHGTAIFGGWAAGTEIPANIEGFFIYAGELGVQFFFVLSGFVMATAHGNDFGKPGAVWRFWWRRACRIYPVYWFALAIAVSNGGMEWTPGFAARTIFLIPGGTKFVIFSAWSLSLEMAFYIMFGLCLLPRIGKPILVSWVAICLWRWCPPDILQSLHLTLPALRPFFPVDPRNPAAANSLYFSFLAYYFFGGLAAGGIFMRFDFPAWASAALLAAGLALLVLVLPPLPGYGPYLTPPMGVLRLAAILGLVLLGAAALERRLAPGGFAVAFRLGALSYPLYILHVPLAGLVDRLMPDTRFAGVTLHAWFFTFLALIYAGAAVVTFGFDRPVQRWLRRL